MGRALRCNSWSRSGPDVPGRSQSRRIRSAIFLTACSKTWRESEATAATRSSGCSLMSLSQPERLTGWLSASKILVIAYLPGIKIGLAPGHEARIGLIKPARGSEPLRAPRSLLSPTFQLSVSAPYHRSLLQMDAFRIPNRAGDATDILRSPAIRAHSREAARSKECLVRHGR